MEPRDQDAIDRVQALLDWLAASSTEQGRCLAFRLCNDNGSRDTQQPQRMATFDWLGSVARADQVSLAPPHPAVIIIVDDDIADAKHMAGVVGRLRDIAGGRVLIVGDVSSALSDRELLALGYERREHPTLAADIYLHDPDDFYPAREWNNAERWANPQNFGRYRW